MRFQTFLSLSQKQAPQQLAAVQARHGAAGTATEQQRRSPILEIAMLLAECIQHGLRTIAFCKTRKVCELVTSYTREVLKETAPALTGRLAVYRCATCNMHAGALLAITTMLPIPVPGCICQLTRRHHVRCHM